MSETESRHDDPFVEQLCQRKVDLATELEGLRKGDVATEVDPLQREVEILDELDTIKRELEERGGYAI